MKGHDLRLLPMAAAAWSAAWLGSSGTRPDPGPLLVCFVGLGLLITVAARSRRPWLAMAIAVFAVTVFTAGLQSWHRHTSPISELAARETHATVQLKIQGEPRVGERVIIVRAELHSLEARGRQVRSRVPVVALGSGSVGEQMARLTPGAVYVVAARLGRPEADDEVAAVLSVREVGSEVVAPGSMDAIANTLRQGLREAVAHSPPEQAALVPSLVVGDTSAVTSEMRDEFRTTGLTHLMAVSGANLTLMLGVVLTVARGMGIRAWALRGTAVAGVGAFVVVCGQEPSVLRAAAMGLVGLAAIGAGIGRRSIRSLCIAIMGLVWCDPWIARSPGFALSVVASAGIVWLGPLFMDALTRWAPRWVAEGLAVPLAAQLATQPLVTSLNEELSVVGLLANVFAGPFVGPTTVLGFAAALLSPVPMLAAGPGWLAGWASQPILWLAGAGAALPSPAWRWEATPLKLVLLVIGVVALTVVLVRVLRYRIGAGLLTGAVTLASFMAPVPIGWPGPWAAAFCDVGQGDATVVQGGSGMAILVDTGPEAKSTLQCLRSLRIAQVPLLVLTHYHADHVGGAEALIARYRPSLILVRQGDPPAWLIRVAADAGSSVRPAETGEHLTVGGATWTTASVREPAGDPSHEAESEGSAENDASIVGVASSGGLRILLAGDTEPLGQSIALSHAAAEGVDLRVHVLKLPHHGSSRQEPRLFAASDAALAVASSGEGNSYGHPASSTLALARSHAMVVARTDTQGTIVVNLSDDHLQVRSQR